MPKNVIKRDGSIVEFNRTKIENAIAKAYQEVYPQINIENYKLTINNVTDKIYKEIVWVSNNSDNIDIEIIQDIVERELMSLDKSVAKEYITYRYTRKLFRDNYTILMDAVQEKLMATNVKNQNANVDERSFGGRLGEATDLVSKKFTLDNLLSDKSKENHLNNLIYEHDLSHYAVGDHNCLSAPLDDLLAKGFNTRQTDVRPAQSVSTALQLVAVIFQLQSLQQFGGVSSTHLDFTLVPYIRKSFLKHYICAWLKDSEKFYNLDFIEMLFNITEVTVDNIKIVYNEFDSWVDKHKQSFFNETNTKEEDYYLGNTNLNKKYYQQALYDTIIETKQGVEGLYHNLNTLQSRSGNQLPFTSINYGTATSIEGRLVTKCVLDCSIRGIGKLHKTSIFPCGIFQYSKKINGLPGTPNYDLYKLALKSTALRLYPNYANCDVTMQTNWVKYDRHIKEKTINTLTKDEYNKLIERLENNKKLKDSLTLDVVEHDNVKELKVRQEQLPIEIMSTMGCRTQNGADINFEESYINNVKSVIYNGCVKDNMISAAQKDGRGNICPVTIILPSIAMEAKTSLSEFVSEEQVIDKFMSLLETKINEAKDMLIERYDWICNQSAESAKFMYENNLMYGYIPELGIKSALRHGTLALGQLGLAETLQILVHCNQLTDKGMKLAKHIEQLFKDKCNEFKEQYKLNFGVYYTPAENLCYTAMLKFREKYGVIANVSDKDYFTNSIHIPVWEKVTPFEKIDVESELTSYSSAGCITYVEFDSTVKNNTDALEELVNYAMNKDIPYLAINLPNDLCLNCGYTDEINDVCPMCGGADIRRLRRVTGYLTGDYKTAFNKGKQQEVEQRVKHTR